MAQPGDSTEGLGSWNPASRPENNTDEVRVTTAETPSSEPLVSSSAQDPSKSDVTSPLSEDDFSAWDMPEDVPAPEPQPESLDSVLADTTPTPGPSGDDLQSEGAGNVDKQDEHIQPTIPSPEPSQEPATNDIAPEQPDSNTPEPQNEASHADAIFTSTEESVDFSQLLSSDVQPEEAVDSNIKSEPQVETSADAIFGSTEESVDFSQLLSNGEQPEQVVDDSVASVEEPVTESVPDIQATPAETPSIPTHETPEESEAPSAQSVPTEPAQTSSIDAVFGSSEETDDFSALLSSNAEPTEPVDAQVPFPEAAEQPTEDFAKLLTTPLNGEAKGATVESNTVLDGPATQQSVDSTAQPVPSFEDQLASTVVDEGAWGNQDFDSDGDDFFNQLKTQTKPIFAPPESDSRFEEGVPLLDESSDSADGETKDPFQGEDAQGFPSPAKQPETRPESSFHITRKSTSQVIESAVFPDLDSPKSDGSAAAAFDDVINAATRNDEKPEAQPGVSAPFEDDLDARWEAELGEKLSPAEEEDLNTRWEGLQLSDDDDEDDEVAVPQQVVPQSPMVSGSATLNSPFETPQQRQTPPRPIPGVYAPHQPSTGDLVGGIGFPGAPPSAAGMPPYYNQPPPNPVTNRGESFAERSKEGYKSPYDLPDDLSKPRRPIMTHRPASPKVDNSMPPPPLPAGGRTQAAPAPTPAAPPPAPKNFYEELPLPAPRSRPASSGRYTPGPVGGAVAAAPPLSSPPKNPYAPGPPAAPARPAVNDSLAGAGPMPVQSTLQPPELLDPYAPSGTLASSAPAGPPAASRYSPRPPNLQPSAKPPARYSPAPPPSNSAARNRYASQPLNVPGQAANLPFQPRTSSPLAYHEKVSYQPDETQQQQQQPPPPQMPPPSLQPSVDLSPPRQRPSVDQGSPYAPQLNNGPQYGFDPAAGSPPAMPQQTPPNPRYAPQEYLNEFTKRMAPNNEYAPAPPVPETAGVQDSQHADSGIIRSQTQSPGQQLAGPQPYVPSIDTLPRPASVHGSTSPTKTVNPYAPQQQAVSRARAVSRVTQQLEFIEPTDGQEQDPLQRWKGAPIFKFGFGGSVVSCFPRHIPRYSAGNPAPKIMPTLGEPKYSPVDSWLPSNDGIVPHPGPLKAKSKKKDILSWLSSKIVAFENEATPGYDYSHPDAQKRHEEKILLWKITKILVENDGVLEGSPEIQKSLRQAIFPNLPESQPEGSLGAHAGLQPLSLPSKADAVDQEWSEELRTNLRLGEREKAVWGAVDRRLWGHAMIIASTMEKAIWKQVVQEYVRREVRSTSGGTESIAALYEIFAGNVEESIDELVPPSARAGHHLISKADGQGSARNALDGLESWKDTLGLVLSNRSADDHQALLALGHLLASYGRVEAAHICFIFSRGTVFGGADDPQANIVLLGADHQRFPCTLLDEDSILLTEVYEFATSVLANSPIANLPHLLAFKLVYAKCLADKGRKTESQAYCDSLAASLKATTRPSPYYHQHLFNEIEELSARLRQTASDGASSWISKPSMEKVSGSMWARFNSFVAGDDSDAASTGSGKAADAADVGPFAHVAGTPTVSRSPSVSDLYGSYPGAGAQPIPAGAPSRYLPNQYAPNASPEQFRSRSSIDSQRSFSGGMSFGQRRPSQEPETPVDHGFPMYGSPGSVSYQPTPPQSSYAPLAPVKEDASQSPAPQPAVNGLFYQPPGQETEAAGQSPFYQGPPGMPQAEGSGYMPPEISNSYEPPSFTPAVNITPDEDDQDSKPSMADDDDDLAARAELLKKQERQENDRKADEAFRKAAEEDAKRAGQQNQKKGWFGGWFGGGAPKKEPDNVGGGPIKAKLGEENSFYYDNDLKKWVNKKDPNSATAARATPPPPRGSAPASRASSGSMPPPPAPLSAASGSRPPSSSSDAPPPPLSSSSPAYSGLGVPPPSMARSFSSKDNSGLGVPPPLMSRSVSSNAAVLSSTPPGLAPRPGTSGGQPPRPTSSLSHAQSIDDLLGAPTARKGGNTVRGKKKGRYVDVMAQ